MAETIDQNRYNEQIISRMSQNDQFFGCFLPHLPERGTDHGYDHFPLGEMGPECFAWPWYWRQARRARSTSLSWTSEQTTRLAASRTKHAREWQPSATSVQKCRETAIVFCYHIQDKPSKSGAKQLCQEVCFSFVFFIVSRASFLFLWMGPRVHWAIGKHCFYVLSVVCGDIFQCLASAFTARRFWAHAKMWKLKSTSSKILLLSWFGHAMLI